MSQPTEICSTCATLAHQEALYCEDCGLRSYCSQPCKDFDQPRHEKLCDLMTKILQIKNFPDSTVRESENLRGRFIDILTKAHDLSLHMIDYDEVCILFPVNLLIKLTYVRTRTYFLQQDQYLQPFVRLHHDIC